MFERVRQAAIAAIRADDELLAAWRDFTKQNGQLPTSDADIGLLQQLVWQKIHQLNAFGALVRLNREAAINILLRRYLGSGVSPDRGFGGFFSDMSSMLSDLVEVGGAEALKALINHPNFNPEMLADHRFVEAACEAVDIQQAAFTEWISQ